VDDALLAAEGSCQVLILLPLEVYQRARLDNKPATQG